MKTIVFGAAGMVGSALMSYLSDAVGTYHDSKALVPDRCYEWLDLTLTHKVDEFLAKHNPDRIFIAAANPYVDGCEIPSSDKINIVSILHLISHTSAQVIFFSSSYVFDGKSQTPYKTTDPTFPINRYGRQKEEIERAITAREGKHLIIRTVGVFGKEATPKNFVDQVKRAVKEEKKIVVPSDQTMNPIWSMDLAKTVIHLADRDYSGIHHVSGDRCVSKYEWAISIAYKLGCKKPHGLIVGMKTDDMNQLANRPLNGCLDCGGLTALALTVPSLDKGLTKYLTDAKN